MCWLVETSRFCVGICTEFWIHATSEPFPARGNLAAKGFLCTVSSLVPISLDLLSDAHRSEVLTLRQKLQKSAGKIAPDSLTRDSFYKLFAVDINNSLNEINILDDSRSAGATNIRRYVPAEFQQTFHPG